VKVKIRKPDGEYIITNALIDSGSTNSFCTKALVKQLGVKTYSVPLKLKTLESVVNTRSTEVISKLVVAGIHVDQEIELTNVYALDHLQIDQENMPTVEEVKKWHHLDDIPLPAYDSIELVIGQDCPDAVVPLEVRHHSTARIAPYAVRTRLGWMISGPFSTESSLLSTATVNYVSRIEEKVCLLDDRKHPSVCDKRALDIMNSDAAITPDDNYEIEIALAQVH